VMNFKEIIDNYKEIINKNLGKWKDNYEIIYLFIFFIKKCKEPVNSINQNIFPAFFNDIKALLDIVNKKAHDINEKEKNTEET